MLKCKNYRTDTSVVVRLSQVGTVRVFVIIGLCFLVLTAGIQNTQAKTSRIKDIVDIEGVRENQLVGYGLVVGLNGTGDGLITPPSQSKA